MNEKWVLIADDSKQLNISFNNSLKKFGFKVLSIKKDGKQLIDSILELKPMIVLTDIFLPNEDAISVMETIFASDLEPKPHFMIMSGYDHPDLQDRVMAAGATYYFLKPFNVATASERIAEMVQAPAAVAPAPVSAVQERKAEAAGDEEVFDLELRVTETLHNIGVPPHIKGFHYLREAIILSVRDEEMFESVTKILYPTVAKNFGTTASRVERAIRHAIEVAWDKSVGEGLDSHVQYPSGLGKEKPTNSELIAIISDMLRLKLRKRVV